MIENDYIFSLNAHNLFKRKFVGIVIKRSKICANGLEIAKYLTITNKSPIPSKNVLPYERKTLIKVFLLFGDEVLNTYFLFQIYAFTTLIKNAIVYASI